MSKIYKGHSELKDKSKKNLTTGLILVIPFVLLILTRGISYVGSGGMLLLWAIAAIGMFLLNKHSIAHSGLKGEENTLSLLSGLPDSYRIFNNVKVEWEGKQRELDLVVIGPTGAFIVEVKNHNGYIECSNEDSWVQHKVGRKGGQYTSSLRNPVRQVKGQVYALSNYLKANNINVWIDSAVFFSNNSAQLSFHEEVKNVYSSKTDLLGYISNYPYRKELTEETLDKLTEVLIKCQSSLN